MLNILLALTALGQSSDITIEGVRAPEEAAVSASSIKYLPFDVPAGVTKIEIKREHVEGEDKGVVELGIFDSRGHATVAGFRGWQGTASVDPVITGDSATTSPQYIAGPLPAGQWHLAQWYLKASAAGLKYKYTVRFGFDGPKPPANFAHASSFDYRVPGEAKWHAGNIGAHSIHSDGTKTVSEICAMSSAAGFDFTVITDANTYRHHFELAHARMAYPTHLPILGTEVATASGHASVIGSRLGWWFDFRFDAGSGNLAKTIDEAQRQGAIFSINHPFDTGPTESWGYAEEEWDEANAIQVWNGAWGPEDDQALAMWSKLLANPKKRFTMVGGTEYRKEGDPLSPVVWVKGPLSRDAVNDSIRKGAVVLTQTAKMIPPELTVAGKQVGETVKAVVMRNPALPKGITFYAPVELIAHVRGFKGHALHVRSAWGDVSFPQGVLIDSDDFKYIQNVRPGGDGFYGVEVRSGGQANWGQVIALTNPVYVRK
jgi:hypothetical protein